MASVIRVGEKWRAQVRRKGHAAKCKTFRTKAAAEAWAREVETRIDAGEVLAQPGDLRMSRVIEAYREMREASRPIDDHSNEHYVLRRLDNELGDKRAATLKPEDLVAYCTARKEDGAGPYTINMDVSKLGTVMRYASVYLSVALPDVVGAARPLLHHLRLIGGGGKRERRPGEDELHRVVEHLAKEYGQIYADVVAFGAVTAMRRGEICEIKWGNVDEAKRLVGAWRKHPRKAKVWELVPLLGEAWNIVQRQPKVDDRIFPVHPQTLSKYFRETVVSLGIPDLHFHDLRHEGTSRLFEEGFSIEQVALVTGHKDWRHLRRYTNLRPEDLHKRRRESDPQDA